MAYVGGKTKGRWVMVMEKMCDTQKYLHPNLSKSRHESKAWEEKRI